MNLRLRPLISKEEIAQKVKEVALVLSKEYHGKDLVIVMVLKGALCIVADLIRQIDIPLDIEVVQCSSYGELGMQRGELNVLGLEKINIHNRDVLIVDDIFDSGHTMNALREAISKKKPRSLKSCVLLLKDVPHVTPHLPEYVLFSIKNLFVVGYGLDYKEQYRGLPGIYVLEENG